MTIFDLIPQRIKSLREKCGYSQGELARISGCTQGQISHFETGRAFPGLETAVKLAAAFGITVSEMIDERDPDCAPPRPPRDEEMTLWLMEKIGISKTRLEMVARILGEAPKF